LAGKRAGAAQREAKADKPKGYEPGYRLQELRRYCRTFVFSGRQFYPRPAMRAWLCDGRCRAQHSAAA